MVRVATGRRQLFFPGRPSAPPPRTPDPPSGRNTGANDSGLIARFVDLAELRVAL